MLYDYVLDKFDFECSRAKVKDTVTFFRKKKDFHHSSPYLYGPIFLLHHTTVNYENIMDRFEYEQSRAKVKVTVAIFRKTLSSL